MLIDVKHRNLYSVSLFGDVRVVEWKINFLLNLTELEFDTNNRPLQADLVLYEWVVETNLEFSLKIEKE